MPIPIEIYTVAGILRGVVPRTGPVRDVLEHDTLISLDRATFQPLAGRPGPEDAVSLEPDEILSLRPMRQAMAVRSMRCGTTSRCGPGHTWSRVSWRRCRASTRRAPSRVPPGREIRLRDVRVAAADAPNEELGHYEAMLIHRYEVERVESDLLLTLTFPGAEISVSAPGSGG